MTTKPSYTPALRFPEFQNNGEWKVKRLGEIVKDVDDKCNISKLDIDTYISTENMLQNFEGVKKASKLPETGSFTCFKKGNILFSNIRPYLKKVWQAEFDGAASNDVIVFRVLNDLDCSFVSQIVKSDDFIAYTMAGAKGVKMPRGDKNMMLDYAVCIPPLAEQQRIANVLSEIDTLLSATNDKLEQLKAYKKGLIQKLFPTKGKTMPELRFKEFEKDGEWEVKKLGELLFEHKTKSDGKCQVYSVSVSRGVINQMEYLGRSFAAADTSNYKLVKPYDIVYTKSPTGEFPYGIVKQSIVDHNVIVSPLYGVFSPINQYIGYIIHSYFESSVRTNNYLAPIVQKGAKNTIQITNDVFLSQNVCFPTNENEQRKIAFSLSAIDETINTYAEKVAQLLQYKQGMMQKMFPTLK